MGAEKSVRFPVFRQIKGSANLGQESVNKSITARSNNKADGFRR